MSGPESHATASEESRRLGALGPRLFKVGLGAGIAGLVLMVILGGGDLRQTMLAYLTGFSYFLSLSLGALFLVLIHHLTRAGWSTTIRRIAELMAANLMLLALLALPVLIMAGVIYEPWVYFQSGDAVMEKKATWLNVPMFVVRMAGYFAVWIALALWYWRRSVEQDRTGDVAETEKMQKWSALAMVLYALTVNFAAIDLIMSLAPMWYSTIFGVYFFTGAVLGFFSVTALILRVLQRRGIMTRSVTVEHYHDIGKFMFGFVFFWGYIAFSQYMLIWYGAIPEEQAWMAQHGATTNAEAETVGWGWVSVLLLFGHFLIPFPGLLSRWSKRVTGLLMFWAIWLLVFHYVDLAWMIMPELHATGEGAGALMPMLAALAAVVGVGGLWTASLAKLAGKESLVPESDPRLEESLAIENF